jgi:phenylalanyl-tRNA synthetase beta chain
MKISFKWLNEYIDIQDFFASGKPQALADLLTGAGLEVEGIENLAKTFDQVVVGHILKKEQHPNADRLTLCQVATGDGRVHQIVCGARNHNEGDNVVVALPGAVLPGNLAIKDSKIRGVESGGMLCSEKELGMKSDPTDAGKSEGILILAKDAPLGQAFAKYMGFDDIVFEIKVTPNRADCLSHFGLAREIACLLGREVKFPIESLMEEGPSIRDSFKLELAASDMCPRYMGRAIAGVKVGPSPAWLRKRLESVGMNSINNVVDVTNFVMMELGQPLHAFDSAKIAGQTVRIDHAVSGEKFTTLDGTELTLDGSELTIRDQNQAMVLAGVIGGKNSGVDDSTTEIFLEAAYFTPSSVRRTARKFGLDTDSSYRFSRGTNPEAVPLALARAAQLITQVAGGKIMRDVFDLSPAPIRRQAIDISSGDLSARLGFNVSSQEFVDWMNRLGCTVTVKKESQNGNEWSVLPPLFRWDLGVDMDLVEEFARLHGYQHIPETLPALAAAPATHDVSFVQEAKTRRILQGEGCLQAINYAFLSNTFQARALGEVERLRPLGLRVSHQAVALMNPLNEEISVMRTSVLPGLIKNIVYNTRQGNGVGRLFEIGAAHFRNESENKNETDVSYAQEARLGFAYWGRLSDLWSKGPQAPVLMNLKGAVENLLRSFASQERSRWQQIKSDEAPSFLHPSQSAALIFEGKPIGFIGTLHPELAAELKIREEVALGEFNFDKLISGQPRTAQFRAISKMPVVDRDLAFVIPRDLAVSDLQDEMKKTGGSLLVDVSVFDVFEGGSLEAGQRSVAFRLLFQSPDATLEDAQMNELRDRIVASVTAKFGVMLRG